MGLWLANSVAIAGHVVKIGDPGRESVGCWHSYKFVHRASWRWWGGMSAKSTAMCSFAIVEGHPGAAARAQPDRPAPQRALRRADGAELKQLQEVWKPL